MRTTILSASIVAAALFGATATSASGYLGANERAAINRHLPGAELRNLSARQQRALFNFLSQPDYANQGVSPRDVIRSILTRGVGGHQYPGGARGSHGNQGP